MEEEGIHMLRKIHPDKNVFPLAKLIDERAGPQSLPPSFQKAVAVQLNSVERQMSGRIDSIETQCLLLDWYLLIESAECVLIRRGQRDWHLPCVYQGIRATCCPFVLHVDKSHWDGLHSALGTGTMRWLLLNCIVFCWVDSRAWLQVCGPVVKGQLEVAFPFSFRSAGGPLQPVKRKPTAEKLAAMQQQRQSQVVVPLARQLIPAGGSVQRPLNKIRICFGDGQQQLSTTIKVPSVVLPDMTASPPAAAVTSQAVIDANSNESIVPPLKKIRLQRRNSQGQLEYMGSIIQLHQSAPAALKDHPPAADHSKIVTVKEGFVGPTPSSRKRRPRRRGVVQKADHRRAFDGSLPIAHDEILYSHSGWTHFQITHPLYRSSSKETLSAILSSAIGSAVDDDPGVLLTQLDRWVESLWNNQRRCNYGAILRQILTKDPVGEGPTNKAVDAERVYLFLSAVVKAVVPVELLGGRDNRRVFLANVRRYVDAGRGTCFTLNDLMQSMKTNRCRWLSHLDSLPSQVSLLARVVKWLLVEWIKPLIRQHFYVTETTYGRNRLYFYTKVVWQRMRNRMIRAMCSVNLHHQMPALEPGDPAELQKLLLHSRLRFIPKHNDGSRPIMSTTFRQSTIKEIDDTRLLLFTISSLYPEGMDAKSSYKLHRKWADFLRRRNPDPTYFIHADLEDAYGSIIHEKLIEILWWYRSYLPAELTVRTLTHLSPEGRRSKNFRLIPFFHQAKDLVQRLPPNSILLDLGKKETFNTDKLLSLAIRSVREVHVTHLKNSFRLKRGIPQGSRLSASLCHIYYGHMVREHLPEFLRHPEDLLLRVVDDFLYLTPSQERARSFYQRIHDGFPDYNAHANTTKSATNCSPYDQSVEGPLSKPSWPSFCGLQFNTRTLELRGDYSKYHGTDIVHCITPSAQKPGQLLLKRVQAIATLKIDAMYLDSTINRKPTVVRSMYHACLMAAFRFHAIARHFLSVASRRGKAVNLRFLSHVLHECCSKMCAHVSGARRRKDVTIKLTASETRWLCYVAFDRKLSRHGQVYHNLLPVIRASLAESEGKLTDSKLCNLRCWIGKGIPRSFRLMKGKK